MEGETSPTLSDLFPICLSDATDKTYSLIGENWPSLPTSTTQLTLVPIKAATSAKEMESLPKLVWRPKQKSLEDYARDRVEKYDQYQK